MGKKVEEKDLDFTIDTAEVQEIQQSQQINVPQQPVKRGKVNVADKERSTDNLINCL